MRARSTIAPIVAASLMWLATPAQAGQIVALPHPDAITADSHCTLREAINAANTDDPSPADCIWAGTPGTNDEILLNTGTYAIGLNGNADDANATGDFDITQPLTITGVGDDQSIVDAQSKDRVFDVQSGASLTLNDLKVTGGHAPNGAAGASGAKGGGIRATGSLTINGVTVTGNGAGDGGSGPIGSPGQAGGLGGEGGGIYSLMSLTVTDSTISGNFSGNGGHGGGPASCTSAGSSGGSGGISGLGGGIVADNGGAEITGSTITDNHTGSGGIGACAVTPGSGGGSGYGGGIVASLLTLTESTVSQNSTGAPGVAGFDGDGPNSAGGGSSGSGGGIYAFSGATIRRSSITGNFTSNGANGQNGTGANSRGPAGSGGNAGGALPRGNVEITDSTFADNHTGNGAPSSSNFSGSGGSGGGLAVVDPFTVLTIRGSTFSGNSTGAGGGPSAFQPGNGGNGGGIFFGSNISDANTGTIADTTVTGNTTGAGGNHSTPGFTGGFGGRGGGIAVGDTTTLTLAQVTIHGNSTGAGGQTTGVRSNGGALSVFSAFTASTVTVRNSILAANDPATCSVESGTLTDGGHNLVFGEQCSEISAVSTADPLLGALSDNGGPTKTMALGDGSPARDVVPSTGAGCTPTDQRGTTRPQGSACDAGAFEVFVPPPPAENGGGGGGTGTGTGTGGNTQDRTPPTVRLLLTRQKLLRALKKGYICVFSTSELGSATAELFAVGKTARGAATRRKRAARGTLKITKTGRQRLVVKFTKKARKAFAKRKKVTLSLVLTVKDAAGNGTRKTAKVRLKR
jgi:CSLREA domain-containing protein